MHPIRVKKQSKTTPNEKDKKKKKSSNSKPVSETPKSTPIPNGTVDVSSVWHQMKVSSPEPLNVPSKKRKYPQNNEELKYHYDNSLSSSTATPSSNTESKLTSSKQPQPAAQSSAENKINYNQLPLVKNSNDLKVHC